MSGAKPLSPLGLKTLCRLEAAGEGLFIGLLHDRAAPAPERRPPFVSIALPGGDLALFLEMREGGRIVAAQRLDGRWRHRVELAAGEGGPLPVALAVTADAVGLTLGGLPPKTFPLAGRPLAGARLEALGAWQLEAAPRPLAALLTSSIAPAGRESGLEPDLVFDIGANNGDDTAFYLAKGFRVVAVEANPALAASMAARFARDIAAGRLVLLNLGLAPSRGEMVFYVNTIHSEWSSFNRAVASRGHPVREVTVATVTTEDLFAAYGVPHFAKVDIEGYDHVPVEAIAAHPVRPTFVSFENGASGLFEALAAAGYDRFQLVNQALVPEARCPVPAREGETVAFRFNYGASGPFGNDLPDAWLGVASMREALAAHHAAVAAAPDTVTGAWYDLHARRGG